MEDLIREVDVQTVTVTLSLKNIRAEEVLEEVRGMVTPSAGRIEVNTTANQVTVTDTLSKVEKIRRSVESLDARGRKIMLEAKLVRIVLNDEHLNGVDWGGIVTDLRSFRLEGLYNFLTRGGRGALLTLGVVTQEDLRPLIEALDTVGAVNEYPSSDVIITANVEARMVVRFDEPYLSLSEARLEDAPEKEEPITSGQTALEFLVKPMVSVDGTILTSVVPHESSVALRGSFKRSRGEAVSIEEGNTAVLGNLIATDEVATLRKIPLMGDLPLLGFAFRYHRSAVRHEEFIIFLTPKTIEPTAAKAPVVSQAETATVPADGAQEPPVAPAPTASAPSSVPVLAPLAVPPSVETKDPAVEAPAQDKSTAIGAGKTKNE